MKQVLTARAVRTPSLAETHLEHLAITRKPITALADRLPAVPPDLPEHSDYRRILGVFNDATGPQRVRDVCEALDHELLPKKIEGTGAKLKRLVKLGILTKVASAASLGRSSRHPPGPAAPRQPHRQTVITSRTAL
ncbi:hypothetical protein [Streptomyces flaveolus]|uniref:hypothetical protein n=1 Tax=Streptomyces flaveolus TaxID=67297 RepID=UPI0036F9611D